MNFYLIQVVNEEEDERDGKSVDEAVPEGLNHNFVFFNEISCNLA